MKVKLTLFCYFVPMENPVKAWWEARYRNREYVYGTVPNRYFRDKIQRIPPGKMLMVCEGEGRNAVYASLKGWQVVAMDYSELARNKALKLSRLKNAPILYELAAVEEYDFQVAEYDAAVLIFCHFAPDVRKSVHRRVVTSLKSHGKVILEAFSTEQFGRESGGPLEPEMLYDKKTLEEDFAGLIIYESEQKEVLLNEGIYHVGMANVIRLFAEKA
jgi:hypothetical protein